MQLRQFKRYGRAPAAPCAFGNFAQRRDDFAVIGFEQWLGTFEKLFCSLGAHDNKLETIGNLAETILRP